MLDRRRARSTSLRMELPEDLRDSSFWIPAFSVAAAARERGGEWEGDGDGLRRASMVEVVRGMRICCGEPDGDLEGGSEFKSGGIIGAAQGAEYKGYTKVRRCIG